ncbi:MAG TPA: hypothetical protein H9830_01575 [Candidatus Agrococcus pullicola]|uniref:Tetratricopeptide repeat protein n=1 Tax=Candidatus Agrococcus pullicola TaxID=2838429 RepID=A0A9D1YTW2_9MICO|nr:hypothetical protein [Candidatus Agrococcus pullicola]
MTITDGQRRRWRNILMLCVIPVALVGLAVSTKFFTTEMSANSSITAYDHRAYQEAADQTEPLFWWNFYEQWRAPYNKGVALGMSGELEESRQLLEEALTLHPDPESNEFCVIYTNLVYVIEKQGDEQREIGDRDTANQFYYEALGLIEQAPPGCLEEPAERDPNILEQLTESVPRIEAKIEEDDGGGDDDNDDNGDSNNEENDDNGGQNEEDDLTEQEQELLERQRQSERDRQEQDGYGDDENGGGDGVDKPW